MPILLTFNNIEIRYFYKIINSRKKSCIPDAHGPVKGARYDLISIIVVMQRNNFRRMASQRTQFLTCRIQIECLA